MKKRMDLYEWVMLWVAVIGTIVIMSVLFATLSSARAHENVQIEKTIITLNTYCVETMQDLRHVILDSNKEEIRWRDSKKSVFFFYSIEKDKSDWTITVKINGKYCILLSGFGSESIPSTNEILQQPIVEKGA